MAIGYFSEAIAFTPANPDELTDWLEHAAAHNGHQCGEINYIFCTDKYLLDMNRHYLEHDFYTDIITFDYTEGSTLAGDIFISIDRVKDNASQRHISANEELHRVMAHGMLHLSGFSDKTPDQQAIMQQKEDFWLNLRSFLTD